MADVFSYYPPQARAPALTRVSVGDKAVWPLPDCRGVMPREAYVSDFTETDMRHAFHRSPPGGGRAAARAAGAALPAARVHSAHQRVSLLHTYVPWAGPSPGQTSRVTTPQASTASRIFFALREP